MSSGLRFRNVDASPDDPVETWPFEGILAALERGGLPDWRRMIAAIQVDPWGEVARQVEAALGIAHPQGTSELFQAAIAAARAAAALSERAEVAGEVHALLKRSGLSRTGFATGIGTSASRMSTYLSGRVTPSAALLVRMRRLAGRAERDQTSLTVASSRAR